MENSAAPVKKMSLSRAKRALKIYQYILPYKWHFIVGFISLVISSGIFAIIPGGFKSLIDSAVPGAAQIENVKTVLKNNSSDHEKITAISNLLFSNKSVVAIENLKKVGIYLGAILIGISILSFLRIYLFEYVSQHAMAAIRNALYEKIVSLPYFFFEENKVGNLTSRITADVAQLQDGLTNQLAFTVRQIVLPIVCIPLLFAVSHKLTFIMLLPLPILIFTGFFFAKFIQRKSRESQTALADTNAMAEETFHSIDVVKSFTNEIFEVEKFNKQNNILVKLGMEAAFFRSLFVAYVILMMFGAIVFLIYMGLNEVAIGKIGIGQLIEFFLLSLFIGTSLGGLSESAGILLKTLGASERILEILDETNETKLSDTAPIKPINGNVKFNDVHFKYPSRPDILIFDGLTFEVKKGEKIALVGPSGSGKSSIIKLLSGLYPITSGEIIIDDTLLAANSLKTVRNNIGIVPQEVLLFSGSIFENIAYGKINATIDEVTDAAKKANAFDFIQQFPEKFDTLVGERGVKLSGGQKQRIAIARAILRNPSILILDEATSALDSESELLVKEALDKLMVGRTTFIIAHRLSTIRKADRIFVINKGKIVEQGSHEMLMNIDNGLYRNLLNIQYELD